ncbi:MAG: tRNA (guanosine(46)-N7)-methyltransferase TrmB [Proteobacteria bacterium]|nr:tRNA (guanosine(46)-N7)-methyltransferase TrmB [Pseudomonadota bacterium]
MTTGSNQHRPIRSYVLRERRMTSAQKDLLEVSWSCYGIDFSQTLLDLNQVFGRTAPRILEIGTGMGDATVQMANKHRENDYLAVEVHRPGIGSLMRRIEEDKLSNIRIISYDIVDILKYQLPENSIDCVYIFFPDPWPKKKHHKRRLISSSLIPLIKKALKKHGRLFIATDWEDYANQISEIIYSEPDIINLAGRNQYSPRPRWRPMTKFEQRGLNKGHRIYDFALAFKK